MCRFRVNGRPIRHIFHRFQNVPAKNVLFSCEREAYPSHFHRFQNVPAKNVPFSCEREAYPSYFSPFSKCVGKKCAVFV